MNLNERIKQLQEEEDQRIADQRKQLVLRQQEEQLRLQKDAELRNAAQKQEEEARVKFFGILDNLKVRQKLEDVKHQVWQDQGNIVEDRSDSIRSIKLLFDFKTQIPEEEIKKWRDRKGERYTYTGLGGNENTGTCYPQRESTRVKTWHDVKKPSYLEVGVDTNPVHFEVSCPIDNNMYVYETRSFPATLYVIDTDVDLFKLDLQSLKELRDKAARLGGGLESMNRDVRYKDRSGRDFYKQAPDSKYGRGPHDPSYHYSLDSTFKVWGGVKLGLTSEIDEGLIAEFLEFNLALSSAMRIAQHKLPLQLK